MDKTKTLNLAADPVAVIEACLRALTNSRVSSSTRTTIRWDWRHDGK